jgi:hypothetical protein
MGEFRLPSGMWGDLSPDFKMNNIEDTFVICPVGSHPDTKNDEYVFQIHHNGNTTMLYSLLINNTLTVNGTGSSYINEHLGIMNKSPLFPLHVNGTIKAINMIGDGSKLTDIATAGDSIWNDNDTDIYYIGGNVGIHSLNPRSLLDVNGSIRGDYDKDTTSYFGRSAIGAIHDLNYNTSIFSHLKYNTFNGYALKQDSNGHTHLNAINNIEFNIESNTHILIKDTMITIDNIHINGTLNIINSSMSTQLDYIRSNGPVIILNNNGPMDSGFIIDRGDRINVGVIWDDSLDEFAFINTNDQIMFENITINDYVGIHVANIITNSSNGISTFNGKLGINTTEPQYDLHVVGKLNALAIYSPLTINIAYYYISDRKTSGSNGGTFTSGAWQTRDLNHLEQHGNLYDENVSLIANQITLHKGKYLINIRAPAVSVELHQIRFQNITDTVTTFLGTSEYTDLDVTDNNHSCIEQYLVLTSTKIFEVQHRCETTLSYYGYGIGSGFGIPDIFTTVHIKVM